MQHVAIDLHDEYSQICVMNEQRELLAEIKVPTRRGALRDFFRQRERSRVIFEAGPHALWVSELLTELGHEVVACHARRVRLIAESRNKNDRVDAELLARLSLSDLELIRPIQQRSRSTLEQRSVVRSRAALVETSIADQIRVLNDVIEQLTTDHPTVRRLQTIPGVGSLVALSYIHAIEDPARFGASDVGPYLGLTPSNRSSAGKKLGPKDRGRPGDPYVRSLLVQAAWTLMNSRSESELARWGRALVQRVGPKKAAIAVARKLATLMHHLWLQQQDFRPSPQPRRQAVAV